MKKTEIHTKCSVELRTHCVDYLFHLLDQLCFFSVDSTKSSSYSLYLTRTYFICLLCASFTQVNSNAKKNSAPISTLPRMGFQVTSYRFFKLYSVSSNQQLYIQWLLPLFMLLYHWSHQITIRYAFSTLYKRMMPTRIYTTCFFSVALPHLAEPCLLWSHRRVSLMSMN